MIVFTDLVVLILGENGMGREHIAHYLHDKSRRSVKSFVAVNCGWLAWHCPPYSGISKERSRGRTAL